MHGVVVSDDSQMNFSSPSMQLVTPLAPPPLPAGSKNKVNNMLDCCSASS